MLSLSLLPEEFSICCLDPEDEIPAWAMGHAFFAVIRTPEELSVVCPSAAVPPHVRAARGWRCLKVKGPLDFNQVGVLLSLAAPLAQAGVSIFALSTHDTDYILVREEDLSKAMTALRAAGHQIDKNDATHLHR